MKRFRALAGLLGCLAILAAALPAIAIASAPVQTAASEPCEPCPDCNGGPCDSTAARCFQACVATPPTIGVETFALPPVHAGKTSWPGRTAVLHGQSPPPHPLPPRS